MLAFEQWTKRREVVTLGTNAGAERLPFQTWRNFKEAFAPELVARAIKECEVKVDRCIDPFGGSGTTALACQFLGVEPVTIEVNPYLADLIEAKLSVLDAAELSRQLSGIFRSVILSDDTHDLSWLPPTFVAPGVRDRWLFSEAVAQRIESYRLAISALGESSQMKFFLALLGGVLVEVSNVVISGKGRRYRKNWHLRSIGVDDVDRIYLERAQRAIYEVSKYGGRPTQSYKLIRGDCRAAISQSPEVDLAVFSPPYPNSFDYTDVYNIELWMLGYLRGSFDNRVLRKATLSSHVQIHRTFESKPSGSVTLDEASSRLHSMKQSLWSSNIPSMVDGYFADMCTVLRELNQKLIKGGEVWAVVGDSLYSGVHVAVAKILEELAPSCGYEVLRLEAFRSMRSSAQQGGRQELSESLIVFRKS